MSDSPDANTFAGPRTTHALMATDSEVVRLLYVIGCHTRFTQVWDPRRRVVIVAKVSRRYPSTGGQSRRRGTEHGRVANPTRRLGMSCGKVRIDRGQNVGRPGLETAGPWVQPRGGDPVRPRPGRPPTPCRPTGDVTLSAHDRVPAGQAKPLGARTPAGRSALGAEFPGKKRHEAKGEV